MHDAAAVRDLNVTNTNVVHGIHIFTSRSTLPLATTQRIPEALTFPSRGRDTPFVSEATDTCASFGAQRRQLTK